MSSKFTVYILLLFSVLAVYGQGRVDVARNEWMQGYVKLESADKADEAGTKLMALQLYRDAMTVFESVRRKYPDWNPSLLNYRINYCKQKISALEEAMKDDAQSMSRERLLELTAKQTQIIHENSLKIQQLSTSVSVLSESLQRARTEAAQKAASESEFSSLQEARQELERRCQLLQSKLKKAEEDIENLKKKVGEEGASRKLRAELSQQQEQLKTASRWIESLQGDLNGAREDLARKMQENAHLLRVRQENEARLEEASKRVAELTGMVNDFNLKYQALSLKSEQQAVESKMLKENLGRLEDEKTGLQKELRQLQELQARFAAVQDTNRKLSFQIADYENRLQESAEKLKFANRDSAKKQESLQLELTELRQNLLAAQKQTREQAAQNEAIQQDNRRLTAELAAANAATAKIRQEFQQFSESREKALQQAEEQEKTAAALRTEQEKTLTARQRDQAALQKLNLSLDESKDELARKQRELAAAQAEVNRLQGLLQQSESQLVALQKKSSTAPPPVDQTPQLTALTRDLQSAQEKNTQLAADLRGAKADLQETEQNLRQSQNHALTLEAQLKQLRQSQDAFTDIVAQIQSKDKLLSSRNAEIQQQAERLATANAAILAKTDELTSAQTELQSVKRKMTNLETTNERLLEQVTNFTRRQGEADKIAAAWQQQLQEHTRQQQELQQRLQEAQTKISASNQLTVRLEQALAQNEQQVKVLEKRLADGGQELKRLQEQLDSSATKSAAVDGLTNNLLDLQKALAAREREVEALGAEQQSRQTQLSVLTEQLRRKDEQLKELLASNEAKSERIWLARLAELNAKLENEENRRKALEVTLIQKESESRRAAEKPAAPATPSPTGSTAAVQPGKFLAGQEVLANGFLRQALDAERNAKIEAAQWNYQKVLEIQPDNLIALKRLGLLASNSGNFEDTVKYLKLAFRYDPDDQEVLLALGFAMLNLGQTEWAFSFLGRAVALAPDNADTARLFGGALVDLGWTQAAEQQFKRTLAINPRDAYSAFNLAVLCLTGTPQRLEEARKWYEQAVANGAEKDPKFEAAFKTRQ